MVSAFGKLIALSCDRCRKGVAFSRSGVVATIVTLAMSSGHAAEQSVYSRFGYCAPPLPPACVGSSEQGGASSPSCRAEADAYVASVFKYRGCLAAEMERAVREANTVIGFIRCASDRTLCEAPDGPATKKP